MACINLAVHRTLAGQPEKRIPLVIPCGCGQAIGGRVLCLYILMLDLFCYDEQFIITEKDHEGGVLVIIRAVDRQRIGLIAG